MTEMSSACFRGPRFCITFKHTLHCQTLWLRNAILAAYYGTAFQTVVCCIVVTWPHFATCLFNYRSRNIKISQYSILSKREEKEVVFFIVNVWCCCCYFYYCTTIVILTGWLYIIPLIELILVSWINAIRMEMLVIKSTEFNHLNYFIVWEGNQSDTWVIQSELTELCRKLIAQWIIPFRCYIIHKILHTSQIKIKYSKYRLVVDYSAYLTTSWQKIKQIHT